MSFPAEALPPGPVRRRPGRIAAALGSRPVLLALLLAAPALVLLLLLYAWPVARVFWLSVALPSIGIDNYLRFVSVPVYARILLNTLQVAAIVTIACLLLGYPLAWLLANVPRYLRSLLMIFVLLPFWTSLLVRTFGWMILLQREGPINRMLVASGLVDQPVKLVYSTLGAVIGMTHVLLPFMVLSLFSVMLGIDRRLLEAARTMGAGPVAVFRYVYLPLSMPGIAAGCLLVFIMALGFFITPALMGGPRDVLIAQLIETEVNTSLNWGFASALATILFVVTAGLYAVYDRFLGIGKTMSAGAR
ncbi:MAG: ABC transporter permease [Lautropia sp.]